MQGYMRAAGTLSVQTKAISSCRPQETITLQSSSMKTAAAFEIRFPIEGHVNLDSVSERTRNNYLFARAMIGREYAMPLVQASELH